MHLCELYESSDFLLDGINSGMPGLYGNSSPKPSTSLAFNHPDSGRNTAIRWEEPSPVTMLPISSSPHASNPINSPNNIIFG